MNQNHKQVDYTLYEAERQLKLPIETEIFIEADNPVRLVSAVVERMDISKIERSYSQNGRNEYPPRILLKIMIYKRYSGDVKIAQRIRPKNKKNC